MGCGSSSASTVPALPPTGQAHKYATIEPANLVSMTVTSSQASKIPAMPTVTPGVPTCLHTTRIVATPQPPPHEVFTCYRGGGTSWGLVRAPAGSSLCAATPLAECVVLAPAPGDSVRFGVLPRKEALATLPGAGGKSCRSSAGWSPFTGALTVASATRETKLAPTVLRAGDRLTIKLLPVDPATGNHLLEFSVNGEALGTTDVPAPAAAAAAKDEPFVPTIALQSGAAVLWSGEVFSNSKDTRREMRHALKAGWKAWRDAASALAAEQARVAALMARAKLEVEKDVEARVDTMERESAAAAARALAAKQEAEKIARAEKQVARMSALDQQRRRAAGGNGGVDGATNLSGSDSHEDTAKAVDEFERQEALAAAAHLAAAAELQRESDARIAAREATRALTLAEAERTRMRTEKLQERALRIMTSPLRRCAEVWRCYALDRAQQRRDGTLPLPGSPKPRKMKAKRATLGSPSFGALAATRTASAAAAAGTGAGLDGSGDGAGAAGSDPSALLLSALPSSTSASAVVSSFRTLPKVKLLGPGVTLEQYDGKGPDQLHHFEWLLRNETPEQLIVEMNFDRCRGLDLHGDPSQTCVVRAFQHKVLAVLTQVSRKAGFGMAYSISLKRGPAGQEDVEAMSLVDRELVERTRVLMLEHHIPAAPVCSVATATMATTTPAAAAATATQAAPTWSSLHAALERVPGLHWLDTSFPPVRSSVWSMGEPAKPGCGNPAIGGAGAGTQQSLLEPGLPLAWRRLFSFLPPEASPSFSDPVADPNDIRQGRLGNCWFCSALSAVGETPELVAALFCSERDRPAAYNNLSRSKRVLTQVQRITAQGLYSVRLCVAGSWEEVLLDDFFPCFPSAGPLFTQNHGSQIWVLLVEKAFAKLAGGYDRLISGQAHHALADLTGCPVVSYALGEKECAPLLEQGAQKLWELMLADAKQDLSMCAGTVGKEAATGALNDLLKSVGLVAGHAYTLLHCLEVPADAATSAGTRLLELRNPWGNGEWQGAWSDASPLWTEELRTRMNPNLRDADGVFYMSLEDFLRYFSSVSTCYIRSPTSRPWVERRFSGRWLLGDQKSDPEALPAAPECMYSIRVSEESDVWAVIYQPDARLSAAEFARSSAAAAAGGKAAPGTGPLPMVDQGIMVVRLPDECDPAAEVTVVIDTTIKTSRQHNATARLAPGNYFAIPYTTGNKIREQGRPSRAFNVALLSDVESTSASIVAVPFGPATYTAALLAQVRSKGKLDKLGKTAQLWMMQLRHGSSHLYACGVDPSAAGGGFAVTLDASSSSNARSHRPESRLSLEVRPGHTKLFHHLSPIDDALPVSYNVDIKFKAIKAPK